jgi:ubiquinone/menaquinone biosynthesis C-methylase UbiE
MSRIAAGARASPNIWHSPKVYEVENRAVDPDGVIEKTMREIRAWDGARILDVGCGTGFHLPRFAREAADVVGVEPHGDLASLARLRCRRLRNVQVLKGAAQQLPVPSGSIDVAHARWAYFFGPGCEPGLHELERVMRRGGVGFIIDNDATRSTFGRWFSSAVPDYDARAVDDFFSRHGWSALRREIRWEFESRADFEAVVGIEFAPEPAARILAEYDGCRVDYAVTIRVRRF